METSGRVREAMRRRGHEAVSCDFLPSDDGSPHHIVGNVMDHVLDWKPDLAIFHPTCTYLAHSGSLHLYRGGLKENGPDEYRWAEMERAAIFFRQLLDLPIPKIAVENPKMHGHALKIVGRRPDQLVHPNWFGDDASKTTGLWLKNLPRLVPTAPVAPRTVDGRKRWANQTDGGQNNVSNTSLRWKKRSETFPGLAHAFASQWTPDLRGLSKMYVRYEVRPVVEQHPGDKERGECVSFKTIGEFTDFITVCERESIPHDKFWSIYGIDQDGMAECIGDYDTEDHAFDVLEGMLGVLREITLLGVTFSGYRQGREKILAMVEGSSQRRAE